MHSKRIAEKIEILKNRYNEFYLNVHPRRKLEHEKAKIQEKEIEAMLLTGSSLHLKTMVSSAKRIDETHSAKDIDYDLVEVDVREQDNTSDVE